MKWYNSVKVKLLGFFILISIVFLFFIIITFFVIRENNLERNANESANLATSFILQYIKVEQTKATELVLTLASVAEENMEYIVSNDGLIPSILSTNHKKNMNIVSGGIWFEPFVIGDEKKDYTLFYNRNMKDTFELVPNYVQQTATNYRDTEFYTIAKKLKSSEVAWTNVYRDPVTDVTMITVVSPVYRKQRFIGVVSVDVKIGKRTKKFWNTLESKNMYLMIVDKNGNFIGKSDNISQAVKEDNIYALKHTKMNDLITTLKPVLTNNITYKHLHAEDHFNSIHFIDKDPVFDDESIVAVYHFSDTHWNVIIGILKDKVMAESDETFRNVLMVIILLTLLVTLSGYLTLKKLFVDPMQSITEQLKNNIDQDGKHYEHLVCKDKGEIGTLVHNLNTRTIRLEETQKREAKEIAKRMQNEKMLIQQSKMALMGEMMDSVAHQWKQPLNALTLYSELIKSDFEEGNVDQSYIEQYRNDMQIQIDHMVNTLDEFRTFFRPNKEHEAFKVSEVINSVLFLAKDDILKNRINVSVENDAEIELDGFSNEFKHLFLNLISNAKDAFNENGIEKRSIVIRVIDDEKGKRVEVEDNAGGIPEEIISNIFKANVTSKEEGKGTGIGLYMSMQIAKKHHAILSVKNKNEGACFTVHFEA